MKAYAYLLVLILILPGCGQKGPLYLPIAGNNAHSEPHDEY